MKITMHVVINTHFQDFLDLDFFRYSEADASEYLNIFKKCVPWTNSSVDIVITII